MGNKYSTSQSENRRRVDRSDTNDPGNVSRKVTTMSMTMNNMSSMATFSFSKKSNLNAKLNMFKLMKTSKDILGSVLQPAINRNTNLNALIPMTLDFGTNIGKGLGVDVGVGMTLHRDLEETCRSINSYLEEKRITSNNLDKFDKFETFEKMDCKDKDVAITPVAQVKLIQLSDNIRIKGAIHNDKEKDNLTPSRVKTIKINRKFNSNKAAKCNSPPKDKLIANPNKQITHFSPNSPTNKHRGKERSPVPLSVTIPTTPVHVPTTPIKGKTNITTRRSPESSNKVLRINIKKDLSTLSSPISSKASSLSTIQMNMDNTVKSFHQEMKPLLVNYGSYAERAKLRKQLSDSRLVVCKEEKMVFKIDLQDYSNDVTDVNTLSMSNSNNTVKETTSSVNKSKLDKLKNLKSYLVKYKSPPLNPLEEEITSATNTGVNISSAEERFSIQKPQTPKFSLLTGAGNTQEDERFSFNVFPAIKYDFDIKSKISDEELKDIEGIDN